MRRDSWRSVPTICRPPAVTTLSWRICHSARTFSRVASSIAPAAASSASRLPPSTMSVPRPARWNNHRHQHGRSRHRHRDRKSTRLNSSHGYISYAVFCLKKKTHTTQPKPSNFCLVLISSSQQPATIVKLEDEPTSHWPFTAAHSYARSPPHFMRRLHTLP